MRVLKKLDGVGQSTTTGDSSTGPGASPVSQPEGLTIPREVREEPRAASTPSSTAGAEQIAQSISVALSWLCGRLLDGVEDGISLLPLPPGEEKQLSGLRWLCNRPVGGLSACGNYLRITRSHRQGWDFHKIYRVIHQRPDSPAQFLSLLQASLRSPLGRNYLSSWGEALIELARQQAEEVGEGETDNKAATANKERDQSLLGLHPADLADAYCQLRTMSWEDVELQGALSYRRLLKSRVRLREKRLAQWKKEEAENRRLAQLGKELAPNFLRQVLKDSGVLFLGESLPPLMQGPFARAFASALERLTPEEKEAIARRLLAKRKA